MESTPTLHMWHDYVCPFCNVEATRIMRIKEADDLNLQVRFHPWPLETANGTQPRAEDEDKWVQLLRTVEPDAFAQWDPSSGFWPASSRLLFAAYEAALVQDITAAAKFDLMVRRAIFRQPRPIDTVDALSELAAAAGLDADAFRTTLEDGNAGRRAQSAGADAKSQGIRGIPTLVLPDGSIVSNPGLKIERTREGRSIRDDLAALRELLHRVAGVAPVGAGRG
jgi:predicted DsbA family dithiol-disulfide isomerase